MWRPLSELTRLDRISPATRRLSRLIIVITLDFLAVVSTLELVLTLSNHPLPGGTIDHALFVGLFGVVAVSVFYLSGLYRRSWRFTRFADSLFLVEAIVLALMVCWLATLAALSLGWSGRSGLPIAILHGSALVVAMGTMRIVRRLVRERRKARNLNLSSRAVSVPLRRALVLGPPDWASSVIDLVRGDVSSGLEIVGALLSGEGETIGRLAGVPVLGGAEMLASAVAMLQDRDKMPAALILCDQEGLVEPAARSRIIKRANALGLELVKISNPWSQLLRANPVANVQNLTTAQLLGRPEHSMERHIVGECVRGRRILVTGAGGTIGSELVRQLAEFAPAEITLLDHAEHDLYRIDLAVRQAFPNVAFRQALCSIRERDALRAVFEQAEPEFVFHAAALKHVPIVEENPCAGVHTNIIGTRNVADAVCDFGVRAMVQVSTDKAVNPVGIMGATKRVGEIYCQALDLCGVDDAEAPRFITVRFGNVLGSSGSIVPLFKQQIAEGRSLTVTHPEITRYFMTVKEAVQLILQSSAHALQKETERGTIFVLDMGEPVKIYDLALQIIRLAGLEPEVDIGIRFVGLRPGEKLYEELFDTCEERLSSEIPGIFEARSRSIPLHLISRAINRLERLVSERDSAEISRVLHNLVRIPSGSANEEMPFGDFSAIMAEYTQGNFPKMEPDLFHGNRQPGSQDT